MPSLTYAKPSQTARPQTKKTPKPAKKNTSSATPSFYGKPKPVGSNAEALGEGRWTVQEKAQFERGIMLFGWSRWTNIQQLIPSRTTAQIKSRMCTVVHCFSR